MLDTREARDTDLFVEKYEGMYKELFSQAMAVLGNREKASEAISDTILDAYTTFEELTDMNHFESWMFSILNVKCHNIQNKQEESDLVVVPYAYSEAVIDAVKQGSLKEAVAMRKHFQKKEDPDMVTYPGFRYGSTSILKFVTYASLGLVAMIFLTFMSFAYVYMLR